MARNDTIDVLIIEPMKNPRRATIPNTLESLQHAVGGLIERIDLGDPEVDGWCNEEGKINGLAPNRAIRFLEDGPYGRKEEITDIICGTFVITGYDGEGHETSLTKQQADRWEQRFHDPEAIYRTPTGRIGMIPVHVL
ncbi:hypothetical protein BISA_1890 [Bifidobacterium saguini DSM 23967]|uniref:DUF3846 domain-containing protein n=1 Tax=Bifidobacterium saguini DSM 23967 TaxID=1437607 RepID=A0A087D6Y7_9BIFI|nr:DUF3846 domain-containing protein [Bifidobacterium saguini]KFI91287.1 hypothetical protein BISA_1890 [Bifidobacterium saguini DSM 23967]